MKSKPIARITTFVSLTIFIGVMVGKTMTETPESATMGPEVVKEVPSSTSKRRIRKGPRTPPLIHNTGTVVQAVSDDAGLEEKMDPETEAATPPESEELAVYLEHLEVLDNPNVDELTMLGELAFEANEASAAYDHYLEVIDDHTDHPLAPFALYKLAWAEFNLGDVDAAIADMELMLEWLEVGDSPMDDTLRNAAPADLALFIDKAE